jgi:hypothetical protein
MVGGRNCGTAWVMLAQLCVACCVLINLLHVSALSVSVLRRCDSAAVLGSAECRCCYCCCLFWPPPQSCVRNTKAGQAD